METNNELKTAKNFNHAAEKVYAAWTEPEQLKQWWKPMNASLKEVKNNLQENGEIAYHFTLNEQNSFEVTGQYSEVRPNEHLAYSWNWRVPQAEEEDYTLTVDFISDGAGCRIEVVQTGFKNQEHIEPHQKGWEQGLQHLSDYLDGKSSNRPAGTVDDHIPVVDYGS